MDAVYISLIVIFICLLLFYLLWYFFIRKIDWGDVSLYLAGNRFKMVSLGDERFKNVVGRMTNPQNYPSVILNKKGEPIHILDPETKEKYFYNTKNIKYFKKKYKDNENRLTYEELKESLPYKDLEAGKETFEGAIIYKEEKPYQFWDAINNVIIPYDEKK